MLKWLVISGVIGLGLLPVHGQEKTSKPSTEQKVNEAIEKKEPQAISVSVINSVGQQASQGKGDQPENHSDSYLHHLLLPETLANIRLFIVGIFGTRVALRTLKNIERQTKTGEDAANAAKDGAKAALLNAQAVINAERPWLLVIIESVNGPMGGFNIFVKNKGRTPAMIAAMHIGCVRVKNISHLPKEPPYGLGSMVEDLIVMTDEKPLIRWIGDGAMSQMLKEDAHIPAWEGQTFIFGRVIYRDLADPTPDRIHETRWISLHQGPTEEEDIDPIFQIEGIGAPEEYAKYS
jgi:hypothetical protein